MTKLSGSDNVWVKHLAVAEQRYCKGPWVWHCSATMKYCGPEFAMVGSIKWAMKGDRMVMATRFSAALAYYRTTVGGSAEITVTQVCQCFSNLTDKDIAAYTTTREILFARVGRNQALMLPLGYIICERVLNNTPCWGFRLMDFRAKPTQTCLAFGRDHQSP